MELLLQAMERFFRCQKLGCGTSRIGIGPCENNHSSDFARIRQVCDHSVGRDSVCDPSPARRLPAGLPQESRLATYACECRLSYPRVKFGFSSKSRTRVRLLAANEAVHALRSQFPTTSPPKLRIPARTPNSSCVLIRQSDRRTSSQLSSSAPGSHKTILCRDSPRVSARLAMATASTATPAAGSIDDVHQFSPSMVLDSRLGVLGIHSASHTQATRTSTLPR
jgi:hypothetical protein